MGEPTFWMKVKDFYRTIYNKFLCLRGQHTWVKWNNVDEMCVWCGEDKQ